MAKKPTLYSSCYPGSVQPDADGQFLKRDDIDSLFAALVETHRKQKERIEELEETVAMLRHELRQPVAP